MRRRRRRHEQPLRFDFAPPPPPPPREARRRRIRWVRFGLVLVLLTLLGVVSSLFGFMTAVAQNAPDLDQFTAREPAQVGFLYARDPKKAQCREARPSEHRCWVRIGSLRQGEARQVLKATQISRAMQDAIVSIEDQRFYQHKGFDPQGFVRAAIPVQERPTLFDGAQFQGLQEQVVRSWVPGRHGMNPVKKLCPHFSVREMTEACARKKWSKPTISTVGGITRPGPAPRGGRRCRG